MRLAPWERGVSVQPISAPDRRVFLKLQYRRPSSDEFLLYSYGPDEDDDQGRQPAQSGWEGDGDYVLNALFPRPASYAGPVPADGQAGVD
jgi:hypothetical protein